MINLCSGEKKMSLQNQFLKFDDNIRLTWQDDKLKAIREKDDSIQKDIRAAFKDKGYPIVEFFQQGSYATKTCIEPLVQEDDYDIDVGVVISSDNAPDNPIEIKKTLRDVLLNRNLKNPKIKIPCVTAQYYKEGEKRFHLDYPIYKKEYDHFYLAVGKEFSNEAERKWESADPKGLIDWVNNKSHFSTEEAYTQYKRLIRYLKRWRDYCITGTERKSVYSIALNVMIREKFQSAISIDGDINDFESLRKTVSSILNSSYFRRKYDENNNLQYEIIVNLPVEPYRDIFSKHGKTLGTFIHDKFLMLRENLEKAKQQSDLKAQCELIAKNIFGDDFPIPEDSENSENKKFKEAGFIASPQGA
jgi:predicted nucleotidyltransferase